MKSRPLFSILINGELRAMTAGAAGFDAAVAGELLGQD